MYSAGRKLMVLLFLLMLMLMVSVSIHLLEAANQIQYSAYQKLMVNLLIHFVDFVLTALIIKEIFVSILNPLNGLKKQMQSISEGQISRVSNESKVMEIHELQSSLAQIAIRETRKSETINNYGLQLNSSRIKEKKLKWLNEGVEKVSQIGYAAKSFFS